MRILQTEFVFDQDEVRESGLATVAEFPAVSCAWFKLANEDPSRPTAAVRRLQPGQIMAFSEGEFAPLVEVVSDEDVRRFLDGCLYDAVYSASERPGDVRNPRIVDFLLEQTIVLEESPPKAVPFKSLIGGGSIMSIGAAVGYALTPTGFPLLLLITIPTGIIVVGSAAGVATALQHGLHEMVKKKFFERKIKSRT